uniref:Uncharacterized protein n=1 Tax=Maylandia zebra TaxID=106582 RepID=A0A3P9BZ43_9CICH
MSLSTARSFLSVACYGEQELDANSALMELDKGPCERLEIGSVGGDGWMNM